MRGASAELKDTGYSIVLRGNPAARCNSGSVSCCPLAPPHSQWSLRLPPCGLVQVSTLDDGSPSQGWHLSVFPLREVYGAKSTVIMVLIRLDQLAHLAQPIPLPELEFNLSGLLLQGAALPQPPLLAGMPWGSALRSLFCLLPHSGCHALCGLFIYKCVSAAERWLHPTQSKVKSSQRPPRPAPLAPVTSLTLLPPTVLFLVH